MGKKIMRYLYEVYGECPMNLSMKEDAKYVLTKLYSTSNEYSRKEMTETLNGMFYIQKYKKKI